jgi:hypothetical protein
MSKDFNKILDNINYFFNIKYIIVHDDEYSYVDILEKILNFPWDVREIFEDSSNIIHNCIKQGIINPNYIFIHKRNTQKIEEEYNNHLFCLIIRMDNSHNLVEPESRLIEFMARTQGKFYHTISELDIVNFNQICEDFNINSWILKRIHDFTKLISYKFINVNSLLSGKLNPLNKKEQEILDKSMWLMEQFNQSDFNIIDNAEKVSLNDIVTNKSFFSLSSSEIHEGVILHVFEHKYYYYGKYSKNFELTKDVRKLAYSKVKNQTIKDLRDRLLFPLSYAKTNNFLFFSLDYNVNSIRQEVNIISAHCRNDGENRKSLSHLITSLDKKMKDYDGIISLIDFLKDKNVNFYLKLYSSLPIGWLNINGCPLALKHYYSLLPRHEYKFSMPKALVMIKKEPLKILIIRSFDKNDRLKNLMESTLNEMSKLNEQQNDRITQMINSKANYLGKATDSNDIKDKISNSKDDDLYASYRFVDVCSEADLVSTLNQATESVLIFDCHGTKIDDKGNYGLYLYGKGVNINDLKDKIKKLPPIVIFSTCDSLPLNANQETSPAQSAINLGAYVAIGTYLPINGKQASIAICRLIHRLQQYVDIAIKHFGKVSFMNVFQGWFIMEYVREVLSTMIADNLISEEIAFSKLSFEINCLINPLHPNWFDKFLEVLKDNIKSFSTKNAIIDYLSKNIALTDSMKYICVGFPEKVWISNNESEFNKEIYDVIQV